MHDKKKENPLTITKGKDGFRGKGKGQGGKWESLTPRGSRPLNRERAGNKGSSWGRNEDKKTAALSGCKER